MIHFLSGKGPDEISKNFLRLQYIRFVKKSGDFLKNCAKREVIYYIHIYIGRKSGIFVDFHENKRLKF